MERPHTLYMSYDGMMEPLGQSQVIAYLDHLASDFAVHLISFEKRSDTDQLDKMRDMHLALERSGIVWHPQHYHKRPKILSTVYDMLRAGMVATAISRRSKIRVMHARSLLSAVMLLPALFVCRAKLVFDIRGFWTDERIEGGVVRRGSIVEKALRALEKAVFRRADHIVTLTRSSVDLLRDDPRFGHPDAPITVIPTCADLKLFTPGAGLGQAKETPLVVGYVGQIGPWYRFDEMIALYEAFVRHRPGARMLVVNRSQQAEVRRAFQAAGIAEDRFEIVAANRSEVPGHIRRMDVGIVLMIDAFSNFARAPTKLAEYLGCGIPCVGDPQVGDLAAILDGERVGVTMRGHSAGERDRAVDHILALRDDAGLPARCVASARRHFSLEDGVARYRAIYRSLLGTPLLEETSPEMAA
jgi:glycosyltransferase involved in cell wall biosynthesis